MFYIHNVKIHMKLFKSLADLTTTQDCIFKTNTSGEKLKEKKKKMLTLRRFFNVIIRDLKGIKDCKTASSLHILS